MEGAPNEAGASLEEGILAGGPGGGGGGGGEPLNVDKIGEKAPSGVVVAPMLPPRPTNTEPSREIMPDRLLLSTYFPPHERIHPPTGMVAPDPKGALEIIHRWSPFN